VSRPKTTEGWVSYAYSDTAHKRAVTHLGGVYHVDKVVVWHYAADGRTYHNTKTQVSADGTTWTTVYDSAVSGEYPETAAGKTHSFGLSSVRYDPWGELRAVSGPSQTRYGYTGQRAEKGLGLYFYGARWYDPQLSRFLSADSIIPPQQGVQAWDRFAYVNNNPLKYTDPSGHQMTECGPEGCMGIPWHPPFVPMSGLTDPRHDPSADIHCAYTAWLLVNMPGINYSTDSPYEDNTSPQSTYASAHLSSNRALSAFATIDVVNYMAGPFAEAALLRNARPNVTVTLSYDVYYDEQTGMSQAGLQGLDFNNTSGAWFNLRDLKIGDDFSTDINFRVENGQSFIGLDIPDMNVTWGPQDISFRFYSPADYDNVFSGYSWMNLQIWHASAYQTE